MNTFLLISKNSERYRTIMCDNVRLLNFIEFGGFDAYLIKKGSKGPVLKKVLIGDPVTKSKKVTTIPLTAGGVEL